MESKPVTQSSGYWDFSSKPTTILDQVHVHGFESSSSSSSHMIIDNNNNNHPELYHLQNGMELLGFPSSKNLQQTHSNNTRDSIITPPKSSYYSLNPPHLHPTDFWKARSESDHQGSYHPHFDHNPIQKHDFSGGYSDIAAHSSSNELSRESETPRFPIEIPLQIETSQSNLTQSLIVTPETAWQQNRLMASWSNRFPGEEKEDDSSLRCVFPCEGNERPSQGLSLSLSPHKPCNIGLQSFELREAHSRDGFCGRSSNQFIQDGRSFITTSSSSSFSFQHHQLKNSKYLAPAQELLNEFCNLGTKQTSNTRIEHKLPKIGKWEKSSNYRNSEGNNQSLYSTDLLQLQERKIKLLSMLEEVDRRYKQYCEQMRAVVSSFESVAGNGAANMYSALASKAMSKHFRCLRDGIVGQIQATKKAMGEKDPVAPGTTRGETPRLKLLDQTLRQQRAFQQMGILESHPWRPQRGLPERSVSVLRAWLFEHFLHPYPSDVDKHILARQTGLSRSQVSNWFINARVRLWKPMVEEMYTEETKAHDKALEDEAEIENSLLNDQNPNPNPNSPTSPPQHPSMDDHKPTPPQPLLHDSESLASIINSETRNPKNHHQQHFIRADHFSTVPDLDFSSYNHAASTVTYSNDDSSSQRGNFGNGGGVTLTLGLQHSGSGGGVNLSLYSPAAHHSLFFSGGEHMGDDDDECGPVEYGVLEGEETEGNSGFGSQGLPYRNLVGAQLLHDFAG